MIKKIILILCFTVLIVNIVFLLPTKIELKVFDDNISISTKYTLSKIYKIGSAEEEKITSIENTIKSKTPVFNGRVELATFIDINRLLVHSFLIIAVFAVIYLIATLKTQSVHNVHLTKTSKKSH